MSLQVWLPLNGNLHNQGLANIQFNNNSATIHPTGKIGQCYYFNGSSYINENTHNWSNFNTNTFSLCCWYNQPSVASGNSQMICIGTNSGWNNIRIGLLRRTSSGYPMFSVSDGTNSVNYNFTATEFPLNEWTHIAVTYNNGKMKMYLNGQLDQEMTTTITPVLDSSQHLGIGAASNGAEKLLGYLNDVRIYDHCLSDKEVEEIAKGLVLHYKLNTIEQDYSTNLVTSLTSGGQTTISNNNIIITSGVNADTYFTINLSENIVNGTAYIISCDAIVPENTCWTFPLGKQANTALSFQIYNGHNVFPFIANDIEWGTNRIFMDDGGSPNSARSTGVSTELFNFCVTKVGFIQDISGYNNNGTINTTLQLSNNTARYNASTLFNGTSSSITIPYKAVNPDGVFTMNLWFYKDALGSKNYETLFGGPSGFEMDTRAGSSTTLSLYMASTRGGNVFSPFNLNEWYMVTMVRDGTNEMYYINGELKKTIEAKSMPNGTYFIGAWSNASGQNYYGNISDFRLYTTCLTEEQILELYHTSSTIDNLGNVYARELVEI